MNDDRDKLMDARLDALLRKLPEVPVASNFTARVLQAVGHKTAVRPREQASSWNFFRPIVHWLTRAVVAAVAVGTGLFAYQQYEQTVRAEQAQSVSAISHVSSLPGPDVLKDFEAVRHLSQTPPADVELLALMR